MSIRRVLVVAGAVVALLLQLSPYALASIGRWVMFQDELVAADVLFVHGGHLPFRSMEGARIYNDGFAGEVWLAARSSTAESRAIAELGLARESGHHWRRQVLLRLGVPTAAIQVLSREVLNTRDEIEAVVEEMRRRGFRSAILVTSKTHSRRVRLLWNRVAPSDLSGIVRWSTSDPFDPENWWKNTDDGEAVFHELLGMVNAWAGSPLRPDER